MKIKRENYVWLFTTVLLALLLALSIYLGISGWYFKTEISYTTDLVLGKTVQVAVDANQANAVSLDLEGSYLSGEKLPQVISVKNMSNDKAVYLRAKIYIYSSENQTMKLSLDSTINWLYDEDGYYYFDDLVSNQNKVALCSNIVIDNETHLQTNTRYIVTIVVESLDESQDVFSLWGKNPLKNI